MEKTPIDILLDKVDYKPLPKPKEANGILYATHEGVLRLAEEDIIVYVLNDGRRIIPEEELIRLFGVDFKSFVNTPDIKFKKPNP